MKVIGDIRKKEEVMSIAIDNLEIEKLRSTDLAGYSRSLFNCIMAKRSTWVGRE